MTDLWSSYRSVHAVVLVREMLRRWWGLELTFAGPAGYLVDPEEGRVVPSQNELCRASLNSQEGARRCNASVQEVAAQLLTRGKAADGIAAGGSSAVAHRCHLGLSTLSAPLWFGDDLAGFVVASGSRPATMSAEERAEVVRAMREIIDLDDNIIQRQLEEAPTLAAVDLERVQDLVAYAAREVTKVWRQRTPRTTAVSNQPFTEIVGNSAAIRDALKLLQKIVRSESTVLVQGESGTGKELIARAIHYHGPRAQKPFVVQNCSAFNDNLLESALFGHARGAFTGAVKDQKGLFEVADGGTFFLDEIGDMSAALQVKLLRVLQEGTFTPVGGTKPVHVDVRIIAASHKDLAAMVARSEFREDLFYRVNVIKLTVPPLRERAADIPILVDHFVRKHHRGQGPPPQISDAAYAALVSYAWPGNIRELENEIERAMVLAADAPEIDVGLLSTRVMAARAAAAATAAKLSERPLTGTLREFMDTVEADVILQGLARTQWNKAQLAQELGVSRDYLNQKCAQYGWERKV